MPTDAFQTLPYRPCVGVMLMNTDRHVFVGRRNDRYEDAWQMPQGGIDAGEDPKAAALRELWEETGITSDLAQIVDEAPDWVTYDLPDELLGKVWKGRYRGQQQKWFLLRYLGTDAQVNIATEHPEFTAWRWLPPAQLVEHIVPFKRGVYEQVVAAFQRHF